MGGDCLIILWRKLEQIFFLILLGEIRKLSSSLFFCVLN